MSHVPIIPIPQVRLPLPRFPHRGLQRSERPMSQMSHLKQNNGKVLETLPLSPGKTENLRYVLPPRGRRQADTPTINTTVVRQRLTLRRGRVGTRLWTLTKYPGTVKGDKTPVGADLSCPPPQRSEAERVSILRPWQTQWYVQINLLICIIASARFIASACALGWWVFYR